MSPSLLLSPQPGHLGNPTRRGHRRPTGILTEVAPFVLVLWAPEWPPGDLEHLTALRTPDSLSLLAPAGSRPPALLAVKVVTVWLWGWPTFPPDPGGSRHQILLTLTSRKLSGLVKGWATAMSCPLPWWQEACPAGAEPPLHSSCSMWRAGPSLASCLPSLTFFFPAGQ